jgi:hypothetical protein
MGLRNIKLRMSRKLLFVSGIFMCISWVLNQEEAREDKFIAQNVVDHLRKWTQRSPLESLANIVERHATFLKDDIFDNYDSFLALLRDEHQRKLLKDLSPDDAYSNPTFIAARRVATNFDEALVKLLFGFDEEITRLAKKYGVF